jgi:hypothetical protein
LFANASTFQSQKSIHELAVQDFIFELIDFFVCLHLEAHAFKCAFNFNLND